jgi:hypothetical protein
MKRIIIALVLLPFSVLTTLALWQHGYFGILEPHAKSFGGAQVFADLVIALSLSIVWMWRDAKQNQRAFWPWCVVTLLLGSFGPLGYLMTAREPFKN